MLSFKIIDLTHKLDKFVPTWDSDSGFEIESTINYDQCSTTTKFKVQRLKMNSGIGTHIDAPAHCLSGGLNVSDISFDNLFAKCFVIDISSKVNGNTRYQLSTQDILFFENKYEKISSNSFVIIYTGWSKHWENRDLYRNNLIFPTVSLDAAKILIDRNIVGLGVDSLGPDLPGDEYSVHDLLLKNGKYIVENIANAELLPAVGSFSLVMPLKIHATEAPVRLIALIENNKDE